MAVRFYEKTCPACGNGFSGPKGKRCCSRSCGQHSRYPVFKDRFWAAVQIGGPEECWLWKSAVNEHGYGVVTGHRSERLAHRVAWTLENGQVPEGFGVLHSCDNPPCVNPGHLMPGDQSRNLYDAYERGRRKGFAGNPSWTVSEQAL